MNNVFDWMVKQVWNIDKTQVIWWVGAIILTSSLFEVFEIYIFGWLWLLAIMLFDFLTWLSVAWKYGCISSNRILDVVVSRLQYTAWIAFIIMFEWFVHENYWEQFLDKFWISIFWTWSTAGWFILFFIWRECVSILENFDKLWIPLTWQLAQWVRVQQKKLLDFAINKLWTRDNKLKPYKQQLFHIQNDLIEKIDDDNYKTMFKITVLYISDIIRKIYNSELTDLRHLKQEYFYLFNTYKLTIIKRIKSKWIDNYILHRFMRGFDRATDTLNTWIDSIFVDTKKFDKNIKYDIIGLLITRLMDWLQDISRRNMYDELTLDANKYKDV